MSIPNPDRPSSGDVPPVIHLPASSALLAHPAADAPIEALGLSVRAYNGLRRGGYRTVGQVFAATYDALMGIKHFGAGSHAEVEAALRRPVEWSPAPTALAEVAGAIATPAPTAGALTPSAPAPAAFATPATLADALAQAFAPLPAREARVLRERLGVGLGTGARRTLEAIAADLGDKQLTRERVRQIESKAARALRHPRSAAPMGWACGLVATALAACGGAATPARLAEAIAAAHPVGDLDLQAVVLWLAGRTAGVRIVGPAAGSGIVHGAQVVHDGCLTDAMLQAAVAAFRAGKPRDRQAARLVIEVAVPRASEAIVVALTEALGAQLPASPRRLIGDLAADILAEADKPLHMTEIAAALAGVLPGWMPGFRHHNINSHLHRHPAIVRCGRGVFGLRAWDLKPYKHLREVLAEYLAAAPGPATPAEILAGLEGRVVTTESTVRGTLEQNPRLFVRIKSAGRYALLGAQLPAWAKPMTWGERVKRGRGVFTLKG